MEKTEVILINPSVGIDVTDFSNKFLYKCPKCDRCFPNIGPLKCHYGKAHRQSEPFVCIIDSSLVCEICNKSFVQRCDLNAHYRKVHLKKNQKTDPEMLYKCDVCEQAFAWKSALENHYHVHGNKESFMCDVCKKSFFELNNLETHYLTHTNVKPICKICFNQSNNPSKQYGGKIILMRMQVIMRVLTLVNASRINRTVGPCLVGYCLDGQRVVCSGFVSAEKSTILKTVRIPSTIVLLNLSTTLFSCGENTKILVAFISNSPKKESNPLL
ncbi:zinc finger protein 227 [Nephila pilipes]|uniref:Zinc finger protein 227 n=1 Tax=Nephila pilipes TaxID=299642 RepID=A0A8X6PTH2_NEPPI|nr:zinc finger protein 227 [Nephila pilipes]